MGVLNLKSGDRVIYPSQGICTVDCVSVLEIGGSKAEFLSLKREDDGAMLRVPLAKAESVGVRAIGTREEAEAALRYLRDTTDEPDLNWKSRQRQHTERLTRGGLQGMVEVLRSLFDISSIRALPNRERQIYDQVRHLLAEELGCILELPVVAAEDQLDLALVPPGATAMKRKPAVKKAKKATEAAPAKKAVKKKAPAKKAAKKKAPAKKAVKKKAPAKKAVKKKAPAKKAAKKKAPAKKAAKKKTKRKKRR